MHPYLVRAAPARHVSAAVVRVADHAAAVAVVTFLSLAAALVVLGGLARVARAQLVTPKTLPVFQNQQFDILPSATAGMAGLSIALDDSLADPFVNPAKATRLRGGTFFTAPFRHSVSNNRGGGRD